MIPWPLSRILVYRCQLCGSREHRARRRPVRVNGELVTELVAPCAPSGYVNLKP